MPHLVGIDPAARGGLPRQTVQLRLDRLHVQPGLLPGVFRQRRRNLFDVVHCREGEEFLLQQPGFLGTLGQRHRKQQRTVRLLEHPPLHFHRVNSLGLQIQQVVVVADVGRPHREERDPPRHQQPNEQRVPGQQPTVPIGLQRVRNEGRGQPPVGDRNQRWLHHKRRDHEQQDPPARDDSQLGDPREVGQHRGEEPHRARDGGGHRPRPHALGRLAQRLQQPPPLVPQLDVPLENHDREIDPNPQQHRRERNRENVQVPNHQRGEPKRPRHANRHRDGREQRISQSPQPPDQQQRDPHEREHRRLEHRRLRVPHLVAFQHGNARQPKPALRMPHLHVRHQPPQPVNRRGRSIEVNRLHAWLDLQKAHVPPGVQQVPVGELGLQLRHVARQGRLPGRNVLGIALGKIPQARRQQVNLPDQRGRGHLGDVGRLLERPLQLEPQLTHHAVQVQLAEVPQQQAELIQLTNQELQIPRTGELQRLLPQPRQVDLVEHVPKVLGVLLQRRPQVVESRLNLRLIVSLDHHDHVFRHVAKLLEIIEPPLVIVGLRVNQVGAVGLELEPGLGQPRRPQGQPHAQTQGDPGVAGREERDVPEATLEGRDRLPGPGLSIHAPSVRNRRKARKPAPCGTPLATSRLGCFPDRSQSASRTAAGRVAVPPSQGRTPPGDQFLSLAGRGPWLPPRTGRPSKGGGQ